MIGRYNNNFDDINFNEITTTTPDNIKSLGIDPACKLPFNDIS